MTVTRYRVLALITGLLFALNIFVGIAYPFNITEDLELLRSWDGYGALVSRSSYLYWSIAIIHLISIFCLAFFFTWARSIFTFIFIISIFFLPFSGVYVRMPEELFIETIVGIFMILLLYFSFVGEMSTRFKSRLITSVF
jgi:hypothetical protein